MGSYLKIEPIRLGKFNNAEYTNFMNRTLNQALAVGVEKIGASETLINGFIANVNKMTEIVAQRRASVETAQIAETDKKADELIVYLMATFRTNLTSPIQAMRNAAETLYLKTKPYWKIDYSTLDYRRKGYPDGGVAFLFSYREGMFTSSRSWQPSSRP